MLRYMLRRAVLALPTLFLALTLVFVVLRVLPGDPALVVLGDHATQAAIDAVREEMGLTQPIWKQYRQYLSGVVRGDFGASLTTGRPISGEIIRAVPYTLDLTVAGMLIGVACGIPLGVISAVRRNTMVDTASRLLALVGISAPAFYLGVMLMLIFALKVRWFPTVGGGDLSDLGARLHHLVLPAVTVGLIQTALIMRVTRASILELLHEDYVRTARAKGLAERVVVFRHVVRNAMIPIVTVLGLSTSHLLTGTVITETVFSRPGLGSLVIRSIEDRDYTLLQGGLAFFVTAVICLNLAVDLLYGAADPRVRQ